MNNLSFQNFLICIAMKFGIEKSTDRFVLLPQRKKHIAGVPCLNGRIKLYDS